MGKKHAGGVKTGGDEDGPGRKHLRIELSEHDHRRLKAVADRVNISMAAYMRQALMLRIEEDERRMRQS